MFFLKAAFCRVFQTAFRLALPVLPYREPEIVNSCAELDHVFKKENIHSVLIVTDKGIRDGECAYKKLHQLGIAAGVCAESDSHEAGAKKFITAIKELNAKMGVPNKLTGIQAEDIPEMAKYAEKEANPLYPVPMLMTQKELEQFYNQIADWSK